MAKNDEPGNEEKVQAYYSRSPEFTRRAALANRRA